MKDLAIPEPEPQDGEGEWFTERLLGVSGLSFRVTGKLHEEQSPYQRIEVYQTAHHGRLLVLDGCVMLTEHDEFVYHEMLTHPGARILGADLRQALVVGGGDGGIVGELLRYPQLEVTLAELDERVVRVCQELLPDVSAGLEDPRVTLVFDDGAQHMARAAPGSLDLVLVDSTDPVGPAQALIGKEFYETAATALGPRGVLVAQTQSPFYHSAIMRRITAGLCEVFAHVAMYWAVIPSYPGALWTFCVASQERDPTVLDDVGPLPDGLRYYTPEVHRAAFALPPFVQACLPEGHPQRSV